MPHGCAGRGRQYTHNSAALLHWCSSRNSRQYTRAHAVIYHDWRLVSRPCPARLTALGTARRSSTTTSHGPVKTTEEKPTSAERIFRSGTAPSAASSIVRPRRRTGLHDSAARRRRRAYLSLPGPGGEGSVRRHPGARRHVRLQASVEPRPMSSCVGWRDQSLPCVTAVVAARHQARSNFSGQFSAASRAATPARARGACLGSGRGSAKC